MKKILIFILTSVCVHPIITFALPAECADRPDLSQCKTSSTTGPTSSSTETTIFTSEMVPGANCQCVTQVDDRNEADKMSDAAQKATYDPTRYGKTGVACGGEVAKRKYKCTLPTGLAGFQTIFAQIIRWVINIVLLLGVLAVVGLGIAWSFAGGDDIKAKSTLKKWAINIIIGLIILFFFTYILRFLAPWVYQ